MKFTRKCHRRHALRVTAYTFDLAMSYETIEKSRNA